MDSFMRFLVWYWNEPSLEYWRTAGFFVLALYLVIVPITVLRWELHPNPRDVTRYWISFPFSLLQWALTLLLWTQNHGFIDPFDEFVLCVCGAIVLLVNLELRLCGANTQRCMTAVLVLSIILYSSQTYHRWDIASPFIYLGRFLTQGISSTKDGFTTLHHHTMDAANAAQNQTQAWGLALKEWLVDNGNSMITKANALATTSSKGVQSMLTSATDAFLRGIAWPYQYLLSLNPAAAAKEGFDGFGTSIRVMLKHSYTRIARSVESFYAYLMSLSPWSSVKSLGSNLTSKIQGSHTFVRNLNPYRPTEQEEAEFTQNIILSWKQVTSSIRQSVSKIPEFYAYLLDLNPYQPTEQEKAEFFQNVVLIWKQMISSTRQGTAKIMGIFTYLRNLNPYPPTEQEKAEFTQNAVLVWEQITSPLLQNTFVDRYILGPSSTVIYPFNLVFKFISRGVLVCFSQMKHAAIWIFSITDIFYSLLDAYLEAWDSFWEFTDTVIDFTKAAITTISEAYFEIYDSIHRLVASLAFCCGLYCLCESVRSILIFIHNLNEEFSAMIELDNQRIQERLANEADGYSNVKRAPEQREPRSPPPPPPKGAGLPGEPAPIPSLPTKRIPGAEPPRFLPRLSEIQRCRAIVNQMLAYIKARDHGLEVYPHPGMAPNGWTLEGIERYYYWYQRLSEEEMEAHEVRWDEYDRIATQSGAGLDEYDLFVFGCQHKPRF